LRDRRTSIAEHMRRVLPNLLADERLGLGIEWYRNRLPRFRLVTSSGRVDLGLTVHFPVSAFLAVVLLAQALTRKATT
jgi:hypothetical protein